MTEDQHLDIGAILEGLRAEVRARRLAQGHGDPTPVERDLRRSLDEIELYRVVSAHWPLLGKTLPQRAMALLNKLVRRYLRWYINPIVEQQNAYNDAVARALRLLAEAYAELGEQIADHRPPTTDHRPPTTDHRPPTTEGESGRAGERDYGLRTTNYGLRTTDYGLRTTDYELRTNAELMALVRERAASEPAARFPELELRALEPHLRLRERVSAHWLLVGKTLPQRAVALLNKLVRRYLRWYINPVVEQQNAANAAFSTALLNLIRLDAARRAEVAAVRARARRGGEGERGR